MLMMSPKLDEKYALENRKIYILIHLQWFSTAGPDGRLLVLKVLMRSYLL